MVPAAKGRFPPILPGQYPPNTSGHTLATQPFKALKIVPTKEKSITVSALARAVLLAWQEKKEG